MNSKTVGLLGIHTTRPGSSQPAAATESQPAAAASPPVPVDESDEEENSYDQNDTMSEEYGFGDCHIEISDDGNSVDGGGASQRGKKRQKGMKVKLWVGDSQEDGLDIPNTSLEEVGGATQEMRDRIERQYNEKYVVSENSQTDDEKEKSDSDTVVDNSKVFYNKNQVAVLEYIGNEKNKDNVVDENKHRMTRSTAVPSIPTASVSQTASVTVMEEDVEPDEVVPRLDDEDELMFPELVDRFSQHAMEDVYTEELSRPARFDDTNDEEKEENNDSLVAADYNGEDMPTIEWDREDPKLTPGTVFELMWDCRNALTTYCILTQNDFVIVKSEPTRFTIEGNADEQNAEIEAMDDQIEANADGEAMDDQIEAKAEAMFETCLSLANNLALARGVEVFAIQPTAKR
ncbi:hypothetical protein ACQ4PT_055001 [Festuca glaucescens]